MNSLVVVSGKGGTGKTTIVGSFAALAPRPVLADCDVDAANLHLLLQPRKVEAHEFSASLEATIDSTQCTGCGRCIESCAFGAIEDRGQLGVCVDSLACEGCGLCARLCPHGAIDMRPVTSGEWFVSDTRYGPLVHARLQPAEENSGRLVTLVRERAAAMAAERSAHWLLIDGAPGIGCPVIASLAGASCALIVTEPTVAGRSDLRRIASLLRHFGVAALVCVNKWDIHEALADEIEAECRQEGHAVVGRVPYDEDVPLAIGDGVPLVEWSDGAAAHAVRTLWQNVTEAAREHSPS